MVGEPIEKGGSQLLYYQLTYQNEKGWYTLNWQLTNTGDSR